MSRDIGMLGKFLIIADLDGSKLNHIQGVGRFVRFKAEDTIIQEGENAHTKDLFVEGTVDVTMNPTLKIAGQGFGHTEKAMTRVKTGTAPAFGEMSMFGDDPRSATMLSSRVRKGTDDVQKLSRALSIPLSR